MFLVPIARSITRPLNASITHTGASNADVGRSLDRLFEDTFDRFFSAHAAPAQDLRTPALDVVENEQAYLVRLDMPGIAKQDVKVSIDGRRVTVQAQAAKEAEPPEGERLLYRERAAANYARSFTLPAEVDQAGSSARLDSGVLSLTLPKRRPASASQITVN